MTQRKFGGEHTKIKLDIIERYLSAYCTALKNQSFETLYIDAFAGSGEIPTAESEDSFLGNLIDAEVFITGSAHRALELDEPFSRYIFIEISRSKLDTLREKFQNHPRFERCEFLLGDANDRLNEICMSQDWNSHRGVFFLDPFGNQVSFESLQKLASTEAADVWYLFPAGLGVSRQVGNDGTLHPTHEPSLDRIYGCSDWREEFMRKVQAEDLFGSIQKSEKTVNPKIATEFMIQRLRTIFQGIVLDESLPLGRKNMHQYSLLFASANPSEKAKKLCEKLAKAVLKKA